MFIVAHKWSPHKKKSHLFTCAITPHNKIMSIVRMFAVYKRACEDEILIALASSDPNFGWDKRD